MRGLRAAGRRALDRHLPLLAGGAKDEDVSRLGHCPVQCQMSPLSHMPGTSVFTEWGFAARQPDSDSSLASHLFVKREQLDLSEPQCPYQMRGSLWIFPVGWGE